MSTPADYYDMSRVRPEVAAFHQQYIFSSARQLLCDTDSRSARTNNANVCSKHRIVRYPESIDVFHGGAADQMRVCPQ